MAQLIYLVVLCEGETEMDFVRDVLSEHLAGFDVKTHQVLLGKKVAHDTASAPGGVLRWEPVRRHISAALRQHSSPSSRVTTMLDLYAFPRDFPDYEKHAAHKDPYERVCSLESAMQWDVVKDPRFVPYIQLHEFESLVLARPDELLAEFPDYTPSEGLAALVDEIGDLEPERVDQTPHGAPSKRIRRHIPGYRKRIMGPQVTARIGCETLCERCPHFGTWLDTLTRLATDS